MLVLLAMNLLGCASPAPVIEVQPPQLESVRWRIEDIPLDRPTIRLTRDSFMLRNRPLTPAELRVELAKGEGELVYCMIDKFVPIPHEELERFAAVVLRSGGRFFYNYNGGAIDGLFFCSEIREVL